jgi:glycosyltransferase involved in cell wall biosynthesis
MSLLKPSVLLIIEGTYPWYRGGVSEWVYQYLNALENYDFHVLQVATDEFQQLDPTTALYPLTDNIRSFKRVPPPVLASNWDTAKEVWFSSIVEEISILEHSFIHVTNTGFAGWLGKKLAEVFSIPLVLTEHALYWKEVEEGAVALECGYQIPNNFEAKSEIVEIFKDIATEVYQIAENVISVSRVNIPQQIEFGAKTPVYIPNGIPLDLLDPHKKRGDNPVIGWIGRCAEMKNPKLFFEIVRSFRDSELSPTFKMMLSDANEKELEIEIKQLALDHPEVDMIWNENAHHYLDQLDILCITSHNESQPLVMFEALSNKALPVGWEVGDLTNEFGFVVPRGTSTRTLTEQITMLWNKSEKFEEIIDERYHLVAYEHTWNAIFDKYDDLFQGLIYERSN